MHKVQRVSSLRAVVTSARKDGKTIAFVPTMGNLHAGHLQLVKFAKRQADFVVVSIYVNPTQFSENEDLSNYPSTPEEDARQLAELGADLLFLPEQETMYPGALADQTVVYVPKIGEKYCGQDRPEHFQGVTTIVSRLFNMVMPDVAVFGKKDYQQLSIIKRMVNDLAYPVQVMGVDTVRSELGLALSSRNGYLTKDELIVAPNLYKELQSIATKLQKKIVKGENISKANYEKLVTTATEKLEKIGFEPQYIHICQQSNLEQATAVSKKLVILAAARLGKARLIDNLEVSL